MGCVWRFHVSTDVKLRQFSKVQLRQFGNSRHGTSFFSTKLEYCKFSVDND